MTLEDLPKTETYEEGLAMRRSAKSVRLQSIVERVMARRRYEMDSFASHASAHSSMVMKRSSIPRVARDGLA